MIILFFTAVSAAAGLEDSSDGVEGTGDRVDASAAAGLEDRGDGVEGTGDRGVDAAAAAGLEDSGDRVEVTGDGVDAAATTSAGGSAARASLETETGSFNR